MLQQSISLPQVLNRPVETILINILPQEIRVAVLEDNRACEIHIERPQGRGLVGNVYLGTVRRVLPGMQSAFVDIGLERAAFLHIVDMVEQRHSQNDNKRIEHILFEGQVIPVQVIKDPIGNKGARISTQISLAGRFLVHLPQDEHIGISQRIEDEEIRLNLKKRIESLIKEDEPRGFIIRTSAETATDEELLADMAYLRSMRESLWNDAKTLPPQSLLYQDLPLYLRVMRDLVSPQTKYIIVDNQEAHREMCDFAEHYVRNACNKIQLFQGERTLFETHGIEDEIRRSLYPRVNLRVGGYLVIEPTEAMTTIDVNTGGFVGRHNFDETILKTNLEACHAIARELRLRNIGGMVIVDFIDMGNLAHRNLVLQELANALSYDRTRVTLNGFTSLGLVEITRKRTRESIYHLLTNDCPYCHGRGHVKTLQTICYEIFREIQRDAAHNNVESFRILASPAVIEMLIDEEAESLAQLSAQIGKPISLTAESSYMQENFDVIAEHK